MSFLSGLGDLFIEMGQAGQEGAKAYEGARRWQDEFGLMKKASEREDARFTFDKERFQKEWGANREDADRAETMAWEKLALMQDENRLRWDSLDLQEKRDLWEKAISEAGLEIQRKNADTSRMGVESDNAYRQATIGAMGDESKISNYDFAKRTSNDAAMKIISRMDPKLQNELMAVAVKFGTENSPAWDVALNMHESKNINVLSGKLDGMQRYNNPGRFLGADPMGGQPGVAQDTTMQDFGGLTPPEIGENESMGGALLKMFQRSPYAGRQAAPRNPKLLMFKGGMTR